MTDVDNLFREYLAEHRAGGEADPRSFLARAEGADRLELAALIEAILERSPGREWDAVAFAGSPAARAAESVATEWDLEGEVEEASVGWRELLPALRNRVQVRRRDLVARLAEGIGAPGQEEKVAAYYHQMEHEQLPAAGVSNRVLEVLGGILGQSAETLRAAGRVVSGGAVEDTAMPAFSRKALEDPQYGAPSAASPAEAERTRSAEPDLVDELFTGGPDAGT